MRKIFYSLGILICYSTIISCQLIDDTDIICTENCTTITGRLEQANGVGLADVEVIFSYIDFTPYRFERKIAKTKTDKNGNYTLVGYIDDRELKVTSSFQIWINEDDLNKSASENFIKPNDLVDKVYFDTNMMYFGIEKRDTTISIPSFSLPQKANIQINLNGFRPTSEYDLFSVINVIEYGFPLKEARISKLSASTSSESFNVRASVGKNIITVHSLKNAEDYHTVIDTVILESLSDEVILNYSY